MAPITEGIISLFAILLVSFAIVSVENHFLKEDVASDKLIHQADAAKIAALIAQVNDQNNSINALVAAQNKKQQQIMQAEEEVKKLQASSLKSAQDIMNANVPSDCKAAIKWGAKQGSRLYECFRVECPKLTL